MTAVVDTAPPAPRRCSDCADPLTVTGRRVCARCSELRAADRAAVPLRDAGGVGDRRAGPDVLEVRPLTARPAVTAPTFETCPSCGHVLLWADGRLVCPRRDCDDATGGATVAPERTAGASR